MDESEGAVHEYIHYYNEERRQSFRPITCQLNKLITTAK
ncbi:IS3 family transposase [Aggregatibacter actinomycetemcomitans]|nr:IS3 family transposase [Aggregatibacter actinomycetemcomitans]